MSRAVIDARACYTGRYENSCVIVITSKYRLVHEPTNKRTLPVLRVVRLKLQTHDQQMLANMCLPMANKSLSCVKCWPTMLAVYELVRILLATKRQTVRCDWLAVVNNMAAECTDASCVDYANYTSPFYLCIIQDCTQTVFGRLQAVKQITAAATSSSSAEFTVSSILLSNKMLSFVTQMFANNIVGQHFLVVCLRLNIYLLTCTLSLWRHGVSGFDVI